MKSLFSLYQALVADTLIFLKESYLEDANLLANPQDCAFFQKHISSSSPKKEIAPPVKKDPVPIYKQEIKPALKQEPQTPKLSPAPLQKTAPPPAPEVKAIKTALQEAPLPVIENSFLKLEPLAPPPIDPMTELWQLMGKIAPLINLQKEVLDDASAKRISRAWQEQQQTAQVFILSFGESDKGLLFLSHLAKAIDTLIPTKVIDAKRLEKEKKWDLFLQSRGLKLLIAPESAREKTTDFRKFYRETPSTSEHFLGKTPLLLLPPAANFIKDPQLKRSLWNTLCQILKS